MGARMNTQWRRTIRVALIVGVSLLGLWMALAADLVNLLSYITWAGVGAVLAIRRPGNRIALLLMALAWSYVLTTGPVFDPAILAAGGYDWILRARLVLTTGVGLVFYALIFLLTVVFPDGGLPRGPWRGLVIAVVAISFGFAIVGALLPEIQVDAGGGETLSVPNPIGSRLVGELLGGVYSSGVPYVVMLIAIGGGVVRMVVQRARATGARRQQFTLVVLACSAIAVAVIFAFAMIALTDALDIDAGGAVWIPAMFAFPLPPLAIGVAVLRYRLYDIDRMVSRTIGYGLATAGLLASFAALTLVLQQLLTPLTDGRALAVAASTLVVFSLFQPIHRRIQRVVDRRFDRARYDADRAAAAFARGMRDETDLSELEDALVRTVDGTLAPTTRTVWVRERRIHRAAS